MFIQVRSNSVIVFGFAILAAFCSPASAGPQSVSNISKLPLSKLASQEQLDSDFLINPEPFQARICRDSNSRQLIMENGLVRRIWQLAPNATCIAFDRLTVGKSMLRSVGPEAKITIDGVGYDVGGLQGQPNTAYLKPEWLDKMTADPKALRFIGFEAGKPRERFAWNQRRHAAPNPVWPPAGVYLRMDYKLVSADEEAQHSSAKETLETEPNSSPQIGVSIHYELYDGIPAFCKWITIQNEGQAEFTVDRLTVEQLALVEQVNWVETRSGVSIPRPDYLHVETDFAFGGFNDANANRHVVHWRNDPTYKTQVNWARQTPCLLVVEPTFGPDQLVEPGQSFESFRVFELAFDDANRERKGLTLRRMYRIVAPWITENPITHHLLNNRRERVMKAIDEAANVGFEAIILSFGSGFNMENRDPDFLSQWKQVADYAERKGIEIGSYSLFSSRRVADEHMIVPPKDEKLTHGQCPAVTSEWGQQWLRTIRDFYDATGFDQFENDGPYPGDIDVTARPPLQKGIDDSRWVQWKHTTALYKELRKRGVYINAPDYYFLSGSNKCGMGYREVNWSLPRAQQVIHTRQNIYDGTWTKTPSMGWMFVPLSQYHGGGAAATIEPLHEHLEHYRMMMLSNFGMGVQAHFRGPRLFDTDETRSVVQNAVDWFKTYRDILESDIIHGRRADGKNLDWVLHVNPQLENKGMLCVFNPGEQPQQETLKVDLYYTGISDTARLSKDGREFISKQLNRNYQIYLDVEIPSRDMQWFLIR